MAGPIRYNQPTDYSKYDHSQNMAHNLIVRSATDRIPAIHKESLSSAECSIFPDPVVTYFMKKMITRVPKNLFSNAMYFICGPDRRT